MKRIGMDANIDWSVKRSVNDRWALIADKAAEKLEPDPEVVLAKMKLKSRKDQAIIDQLVEEVRHILVERDKDDAEGEMLKRRSQTKSEVLHCTMLKIKKKEDGKAKAMKDSKKTGTTDSASNMTTDRATVNRTPVFLLL